jgi:hypothetical protein
MYYKNWGRLLYDPEEPDAIFEREFVSRFPSAGKVLFSAQQSVSKVPLVIASFWNATWDFTLYSEGLLSLHDGKMTVFPIEDIMNKQPMEPAYMSVQESLEFGDVPGKITPLQLADSVEVFCEEALKEVANIDPGDNTDLTYEIADVQVWAHLGFCFANRLRAAVALQKYKRSNDEVHKTKALGFMETSLNNWKEVVKITEPIYNEVPLVHMNSNDNAPFHWSLMQRDLEEEIEGFRH